MAFLSHSIPWHTLSLMFEYKESSNPGPQHPEFFSKSAPDQHKQLDYFVQKFQDTTREHSTRERSKYRTSKDYAERAQEWVSSDEKEDVAGPETPIENNKRSVRSCPEDLVMRNAELRQLTSKSWPRASPEDRPVYPPNFATRYMAYEPIDSGGPYGREGLVQEFSQIDGWADVVERNTRYSTCTEDERNRRWLDTKSCSDILRLLVIDSATTDDVERKTNMIETIFLLAHHPKVGLKPFLRDGMSCCNINAGMTSLVEKTLPAFIYLNLLWTSIDGCPDPPLLRPRDHVHLYEPSYYRSDGFTSLVPRPAYMNTLSFSNLLESVLKEHGHVIEHVFFIPLFAPYTSGVPSRYLNPRALRQFEDKKIERDVFTDLSTLKDALKSMWKIIIYCDMIFEDIGEPIDWRRSIIFSLDTLFPGKAGLQKILGKSWWEYTDE